MRCYQKVRVARVTFRQVWLMSVRRQIDGSKRIVDRSGSFRRAARSAAARSMSTQATTGGANAS